MKKVSEEYKKEQKNGLMNDGGLHKWKMLDRKK